MRTLFKKPGRFLLIFTLMFGISNIFAPTASAQILDWGLAGVSVFGTSIAKGIFSLGVEIIFKFISLLTGLGGIVLNGVIYHTIVNVTENYNKIDGISVAWKTIRDLGNMGFIFVLLYAAIQQILGIGKDNKTLIVKIVVVAILINFSLFFTAFVIDASNVLALTFYDAIVPGAASQGFTNTGLSDAFMQYLSLTSLYKAAVGKMTVDSLISVGIMGSILLLIAAFVFFAVAIMFVIRYVVLIIVLILSPIAFLSFVLPEMNKYRNQWWDALVGQAFFAPIYFALTWITVKILAGIMYPKKGVPVFGNPGSLGDVTALKFSNAAGVAGAGDGFITTFINFAVVIVFLIVSLVIAKEWANKAPGGVSKLTSWAGVAAGGVLGGGLGWVGRQTIGRSGNWAASNANLQVAAKDKTGVSGAAARLALYASKKARSGTFDVRNATIPTSAIGHAIEGTVGRTGIGKKLGLNEVRVASVPVGRFAADQTGVGKGGTEGFKEEQKAKAKRIETREKARDEEYREAVAKRAIAEGTAAGATTAQILDMQKVIKDMSTKEIMALDHNTLANEKVAEALTTAHLKAIDEDKEGRFSESEKGKIFELHFSKAMEAADALRTNINPSTGAAFVNDAAKKPYQDVIKNISDKEIDYVPSTIFDPTKLDPANTTVEADRSRTFLKTLSQAQVDNITKGDKLIAPEKQAVKDARSRPLNQAFATGIWTGTNGAITIMEKMGEPALAKLDASYTTSPNQPNLDNPNILEIYTPSVLNKMAAQSDLTPPKRNAIRTAILNAVTADPMMVTALAALVPVPPALAPTPAQRAAALAGLTPRQKKLVLSAEWLEGQFGTQIF